MHTGDLLNRKDYQQPQLGIEVPQIQESAH